jgi:Cu/Ag efflux pump CusA
VLVTALAGRRLFISGFLLAVACSFALAPFLGQNFFPPTTNAQLKLHVRGVRHG